MWFLSRKTSRPFEWQLFHHVFQQFWYLPKICKNHPRGSTIIMQNQSRICAQELILWSRWFSFANRWWITIDLLGSAKGRDRSAQKMGLQDVTLIFCMNKCLEKTSKTYYPKWMGLFSWWWIPWCKVKSHPTNTSKSVEVWGMSLLSLLRGNSL